jgi:hypothetical protein
MVRLLIWYMFNGLSASEPKPFTEFSMVMRKSEHSNFVQVKYLRLLVQEMAVKVDQGLINALLALFASASDVKPYTVFTMKFA